MNIAGKAIVITGAASGIGRALALACARRGARLLLADINEEHLASACAEAAAAGATCHGLRTDTGNEQDLFALAEEAHLRLGGADIVVNNAGVTLVSPVESLTTVDAQWLMNINFWGVVHGCRAFLPQLRQRPQALLVNISSIFAMVSVPTQSMYHAAKAAVRGFSDSLRLELAGSPVQVLCVHPGGIRTRIVRDARIVDLAGVARSADELARNFEGLARTTAEQAALAIIGAIESGQPRLLIGRDAKVADFLYRLAPTKVSGWYAALTRRRRGG